MRRSLKLFLKITSLELGVLIVLGGLLCAYDFQLGVAAIIGGLVFLIPNIYFTYYAFRYTGADNVHWVLRSFYRGQMGKFMLVGVGFALVFRFFRTLNPLAVFTAFFIMLLIHVLIAAKCSDQHG